MIRNYAIIRESASVAADAAMTAVHGLQEGHIQNEESFTDRMIGAIEDRFRDLRVKGVSWSAMTLTAHQRKAQETEFGADLLGVLDINLPDFHVQKGFLAQAKLAEPEEHFGRNEFDRLFHQCETMLAHTADAFVFLYSRNGIYVVPAVSVVGLSQAQNPFALFLQHHFRGTKSGCFASHVLRCDLLA